MFQLALPDVVVTNEEVLEKVKELLEKEDYIAAANYLIDNDIYLEDAIDSIDMQEMDDDSGFGPAFIKKFEAKLKACYK